MAAAVRNTAIKRIQGDVREMMTNPSDQYAAAPLETNMFDWHFTLRGPRDTEFEGGIYHGRIILPSDYPFKPPNIMLLTPTGRFEVKKKICLSISAFHPEEWQPAWGIRLILEALISFMPTKGEGAIGSLDFPVAERKRLAKLSVDYTCDICGRVADLLPEVQATMDPKPSQYADQIAQLHMHSLEEPEAHEIENVAEACQLNQEPQAHAASTVDPPSRAPSQAKVAATDNTGTAKAEATNRIEASSDVHAMASTPTPAPGATPNADDRAPAPEVTSRRENARHASRPARVVAPVRPSDTVDTVLHYVTVALVVALVALIYKKLLQLHGVLP